jgi:hypothetical protein
MKTILAATGAAAAIVGAAFSQAAAAEPSDAYAPMAYFASLDGKAYSAQWSDEKGAYTDVATYELILEGRALQSTHRIKENGYGGRTIFFYDEGAKRYVYHYFTNAGFHTTGYADLKDGMIETIETVNGHSSIAAVKSKSRFTPEKLEINTIYVGKDGKETKNASRVYRPVADPGALFSK